MAYEGLLRDVRTAIGLGRPRRTPVFACSEEFDYDWAWLQVDDCFEFEPLGVGCVGSGNILRATKDYLSCTRETLADLAIPDLSNAGRLPEKLKAIRQIRNHFGDTVLVVGGAAAPYSSVGLAFGLEETMMLGLSDPHLLANMCEFFVELQYHNIIAQHEAGAHAVWLGDCNAFSGMLSVEQYREFAFPSCRRLVDRVKSHRDVIIYLHNSEVALPSLMAEQELGVDIINAGPAANIAEVRDAFAGRQCFSGNLDPIEVLLKGTADDVARETERIVKTCREAGGYVFSTGEMNPRDVPEDNIRAMVAAARRT